MMDIIEINGHSVVMYTTENKYNHLKIKFGCMHCDNTYKLPEHEMYAIAFVLGKYLYNDCSG